MSSRSFATMLLAVLLASTVTYAFTIAPQGGVPPQQSGPWTVADDGEKTVLDKPNVAGTITVTNSGIDTSLTVTVYNKQGGVHSGPHSVTAPDSVTCGVPERGRVVVKDPNDTDDDGASGTYTFTIP